MAFRTAVIMLDIYSLSIVDAYLALMTYHSSLYGPQCWHILDRADQRAREQQIVARR